MKTVQFFMPKINVLAFILPTEVKILWKAKSKFSCLRRREMDPNQCLAGD